MIVNYIEGKAPHSRQENNRNNDNDESEEDEGDSRAEGSLEKRSTSHSSSPQFLPKEKSLAEMRDLFQDRLADFHCLRKNVYEVELQSDCEWLVTLSGSGSDSVSVSPTAFSLYTRSSAASEREREGKTQRGGGERERGGERQTDRQTDGRTDRQTQTDHQIETDRLDRERLSLIHI